MKKKSEQSSVKKTKKKEKRGKHIDTRFTTEEFDTVTELAKKCGMCRSKYMRMVALGHKPRHRLTEEELAAINTLDGCRRGLQRFTNKVDAMLPQDKAQVFGSIDYTIEWRKKVDFILKGLKSLRKDIIKD